MKKTPSTLLILCVAATLGLRAQEYREEGNLKETTRHVYEIRGDGEFGLKNVNGEINVQGWDQPTVELVVTKIGRSQENMDLVKVEIMADPQRIDVRTDYPRNSRNLNVSVHYDVMLPRTVKLRDINTVNGSVDVDGMTQEVNASTVNGSVKVMKSSGRINAETVNGGITAELEQVDPQARMKFETVNGSIMLYLGDGASAEIDAETVNGRMHSDFPLQVQGKFGPKRMRGTLGAGGNARIEMETVNGSINLYRR